MVGKQFGVLVVDDERSLLKAYGRHLVHAGFRCIAAEDGHAALSLLATERIDVVITDLAMPGMSGVDLMRRLRELDADLPIIVATGHSALVNVIQSIDARVFRYLTKPVDAQDLLSSVNDAIRARSLAHVRRAAYAHLIDSKAPPPMVVARALEQLWLAVQPIVSVSQARVIGYEALLRTYDPSLREPTVLLSAAERLGLLLSVGRPVRALAAAIVPQLPAGADLFINMHPSDLLDSQLFSESEPLLPFASRVVFELTERTRLEQVPGARALVTKLKQRGYRIALDDMGAGYAGLTTFSMLKPEFVKIDITLVRDVDTDTTQQALVRALVALARELKVQVIAEGVETRQERDTLELMGCSLQQGHLFARPGLPFPSVQW